MSCGLRKSNRCKPSGAQYAWLLRPASSKAALPSSGEPDEEGWLRSRQGGVESPCQAFPLSPVRYAVCLSPRRSLTAPTR